MQFSKKLASFYATNSTHRAVILLVVPFLMTVVGAGAYLQLRHNFVSQKVIPAVTGQKENAANTKNNSAGGAAAVGGNNPAASGSQTPNPNSTPSSNSGASSTSSGSSDNSGTPSGSSGGTSSGGSTTPVSTANEKFGMSAPTNLWSQRLSEVGSAHINFRRLFYQEFGDSLTRVSESINAGMTPVISWKTGSYSWAQVAAGAADADLQSLVTRLNAIPGKKYLVIHHEPAGDGTAQDFVAMQLHALPILKTANQASVGIVANGWWWSAQNQGYTDAEIANWIPTSLKNISDFIAADTYQDDQQVEDGSVKASRLAAWAKRTGGVSALGIGEFNGFTAASITNVMNVVKAEPLFKWALVWNSGPSGLGTPLEGARLQAFINAKATPNPT